ncbi:hypothetical protein [Paraliomyxa miuraensis]|uniref:hypothetical protein n=1 Tax=Paraliomyxa miuraensis TaxID=376150 RepID=UPI002254CCFC|nr:hypothetical protein [Paraliomyxa miuraensis]MCX4245738.1 hypothetical protein [Paraliomyxa miuraensis]
MRIRLAPLALLTTLPLLGCGAVEGQDDAERGMHAVMGLLGTGVPAGLQAAVEDGRPTGLAFRGAAFDPALLDVTGSISLDVDVDCPNGGKLKLDGAASLDAEIGDVEGWDTYAGLAIEFDLDVAFRRCKVDGTKIGGDLHYALDVNADTDAQAVTLEWSYVGDVTFRGDIEGRCQIDIVSSANSGNAFSDLDVRAYTGTMCGVRRQRRPRNGRRRLTARSAPLRAPRRFGLRDLHGH